MIAAVIVGLAVVLFATMPAAHAEEKAVNTFKISPVRTDINVTPGQTRTVTTTITNVTDAPITVRPITNDFIADDKENGEPALILDEDKYAPSHSLKRFMRPLQDVTVPARDSKTVTVTIAVPADTKAGGYYGAVRFAPVVGETGGQVNMTASVATLILVRVPGETVEKLTLTDYAVQKNGVSATRFSKPDGLSLLIRFKNEGNVHVAPFGKISIKKGDTVVKEVDFNNKDQRDMILPDTARRWSVPLEGLGSFGKYTVHSTLTYGERNQTVEMSESFWIIPLALIFVVIGGVVALAAIILGVLWFLRGYKKRILKESGTTTPGLGKK